MNASYHTPSEAQHPRGQQAASPLPEWLQLPKSPARCPITGLSRSAINALILPTAANGYKAQVKSASLKSQRGASRGIRLYNVASLLAWIEAQVPADQSA